MQNYIFYKNGSLERPRNISEEQFNSDAFGTQYSYSPQEKLYSTYYFTHSSTWNTEEYKKLTVLKNYINRYSGYDDIYNFNNFYSSSVCLISLNSYYYGSGIQRGTVNLKIYLTGTLIADASDKNENGVLYDTGSNKVGVVLYKEGFILLNNTASIADYYGSFNGVNDSASWTNFLASSSLKHSIEYGFINNVETNIFFVTANKNDFNHSNNITYLQSGSYSAISSSNYFVENKKLSIKNTIQSPFVSGTANFEKETYISKIGLYDKDKKLIGIASLANPVRKTENREFLFKIKLDI